MVYIKVYIFAFMKSDDAIYIKIPAELKARVNQYVADRKIPGGVSGMVKRFLDRKTKPKAE